MRVYREKEVASPDLLDSKSATQNTKPRLSFSTKPVVLNSEDDFDTITTVMRWKTVSAIFLLVVLYLIIGATVFKVLEQPHESYQKYAILVEKLEFLSRHSCVNSSELEDLVKVSAERVNCETMLKPRLSGWAAVGGTTAVAWWFFRPTDRGQEGQAQSPVELESRVRRRCWQSSAVARVRGEALRRAVLSLPTAGTPSTHSVRSAAGWQQGPAKRRRDGAQLKGFRWSCPASVPLPCAAAAD
ncbi:hypothetical protein AAFF_G00202140 [Aldrovandia affinis]|uniref:Uncharacterized protein n=1 Tax=Aldrovandia affinis TaxID=143900 RepID=A0AAD7WV68_9TELE|nr:hypothetical protein AAFF_G00202140 [Aldrovandia affinis]